MDRLPPNFDAFVSEIGAGFEGLYGPAARRQYEQVARVAMTKSLKQPGVNALALWAEDEVAGILLSTLRDYVGKIQLVHVLAPYLASDAARLLVEESVRTFQAGGVEGILYETVPFCKIDSRPIFAPLGFTCIPRHLMCAPLAAPELTDVGPLQSAACTRQDQPDIARVIVDCYKDHSDRALHHEVRTLPKALEFVEEVVNGTYGRSRPGYVRVIREAGQCVAAVLGCEAAPETGFVIQLVVAPSHQGRGLGTTLLRELASLYRGAGMARIALGVTQSNRARGLYARMGFEVLRDVDAFVWWRP